MKGNIVVVSGPSAVGKSRVIREVLRISQDIKFIVSYTTRTPRKNEEEGRDYHFVGEEEFLYLVQTGQMLEWRKTDFGYYGTPGQSVREYLLKGLTVLLDIDPPGFDRMRQLEFPSVHGIYLLPESLTVLYDRILERGAQRGIETQEDARLRFQASLNSIRQAGGYDIIMINENVLVTAKMIVQWAELLKLQENRNEILSEWLKANKLPLKTDGRKEVNNKGTGR